MSWLLYGTGTHKAINMEKVQMVSFSRNPRRVHFYFESQEEAVQVDDSDINKIVMNEMEMLSWVRSPGSGE